jgi:hypothetical protein
MYAQGCSTVIGSLRWYRDVTARDESRRCTTGMSTSFVVRYIRVVRFFAALMRFAATECDLL